MTVHYENLKLLVNITKRKIGKRKIRAKFHNIHRKKTALGSLVNKDVPIQAFSGKYCKIFRTPILKNIFERLLLKVASSGVEEQHLLGKLNEMR